MGCRSTKRPKHLHFQNTFTHGSSTSRLTKHLHPREVMGCLSTQHLEFCPATRNPTPESLSLSRSFRPTYLPTELTTSAPPQIRAHHQGVFINPEPTFLATYPAAPLPPSSLHPVLWTLHSCALRVTFPTLDIPMSRVGEFTRLSPNPRYPTPHRAPPPNYVVCVCVCA